MAVTRLMIAQSVAKPGKKSAKLTDSNQGTKREKGHDNLGPRSPKEGKSLRNPPGWATASAKRLFTKAAEFLGRRFSRPFRFQGEPSSRRRRALLDRRGSTHNGRLKCPTKAPLETAYSAIL